MLSPIVALAAYGQSITQDIIVAPASQVDQLGAPLEKVVDYFTSTMVPSIVVGFQQANNSTPGGLYLYTSTSGSIAGPWQQTAIASSGNAYERAVAFTYPGDTYPGVIASIQPPGSSNLQIIWYENPKNWGFDPTTYPWGVQVINPNNGCHDIRLADMDGDGKLDVVCSSSLTVGSGSFIAFQNNYNDWKVVNNAANPGDGIDIISIAGSDSPHLVGANVADGNIYWYQNPCTRVPFQQSTPCSASRTAGWTTHKINSDNAGTASGNSFTTITINGVDSVITAANQVDNGIIYTPGLVWFHPGTQPTGPWNMVDLDSTYRDVHEINTGTWNGGIPYAIVAEEEQACPPAMPNGNPPDHQTPCRIAIFQYIDGTWQQTVLSQTSTQNQSVIPWGNGLLMADANHGVYGADRSIHIRVIQPSSGGSLPAGAYTITLGTQAVDGGFGCFWGAVPAVQFYQLTPGNTLQEWQWNGSTLQNTGCARFMIDPGDGTVSEATTGDNWTIVSASGGYSVRDNRTGNYLSSGSGVLDMSNTAGAWTFTPVQ